MAFCPTCGKQNDERAVFCQNCGTSLKIESTTTLPAQPQYGGFWIRVVAAIIDSIVVSIATGILVAISFGGAWFIIFFSPWLYEAFMHSSEWQATLGKRAFNMVVTDMNGGRIPFARATGRHFAKWLSGLLLGIGFIIAAFTEKKQALHDMIAETLVVIRGT